jgi:hypothetical protein
VTLQIPFFGDLSQWAVGIQFPLNMAISVSVRLRRVTVEATRVSVLITPELVRPNTDELGTSSIDTERLWQAAIDQARLPSTEWEPDGEPVITPHPTQTPSDST